MAGCSIVVARVVGNEEIRRWVFVEVGRVRAGPNLGVQAAILTFKNPRISRAGVAGAIRY